MARRNFCLEELEHLEGNIGYLDLRCFGPPELIAETGSSAFAFLGHADALIVDLRQNTGGSPAGIALISSYLAINPFTKTNWEGTGVKPDGKVAAPEALYVAHLEALEKLIQPQTEASRQRDLDQAIGKVRKELDRARKQH